MTPERRAAQLAAEVKLYCGDMPFGWAQQIEVAVEQAIAAAVAEEREACAKVAEGVGGERQEWGTAALLIAADVRARGETD